MDISQPAFFDLARQVQIGLAVVFIFRHIEQRAVRRQTNPHPMRAQGGYALVDYFHDQPATILAAAAVLIRAVVHTRVEKLLEQITVGRVDLHAVKTGLRRVERALAEIGHDALDLGRVQRPRLAGRQHVGSAVVVVAKRLAARRLAGAHRRLAGNLDRRMRYTAYVPDLGEERPAALVHGPRGLGPAGDLLGAEDPRVEQITLAFARDWRAFGDDQPGAGPLAVIKRPHLVGDIIRRPRARHRRHHHAVTQVQATGLIGFEQ